MPKQKKRKQNSSIGPLLLVVIGVTLLAITLVIFLTQRQPGGTASPTTTADVPRTSVADARKALNEGQAVMIDVRSADIFQSSHIPGSTNIPLGDIESRSAELDPNQWIITYCT